MLLGHKNISGLPNCVNAPLAHRNAQGPVSAALTQALAQAGRGDDAAARIAEMPEGLDRTAAEARLAAALVMANPNDPAVQARLKAGGCCRAGPALKRCLLGFLR